LGSRLARAVLLGMRERERAAAAADEDDADVCGAPPLASERSERDDLAFARIGDGSRDDGSGDGAAKLDADGVNGGGGSGSGSGTGTDGSSF
jgi:hypothetical protein